METSTLNIDAEGQHLEKNHTLSMAIANSQLSLPAIDLQEHYRIDFGMLTKVVSVFSGLMFLALPLVNTLSLSQHKLESVLHGLGGMGIIAVLTYAAHLSFFVSKGALSKIPKFYSAVKYALLANLAAVVSGNWAYMRYRAPGGARAQLLDSAPLVHKILMETKEFVALYPSALLSIAFIVLYLENKNKEKDLFALRGASLLVTLSYAGAILAMILGIAIAKVKLL